MLTYFLPLRNDRICQECHGSDHRVRGVVRISLATAPLAGGLRREFPHETLPIRVGDRVTFVNADPVRHNVFSTAVVPFDLVQPPGTRDTVVFGAPGGASSSARCTPACN